jgi:hypothetical protein
MSIRTGRYEAALSAAAGVGDGSTLSPASRGPRSAGAARASRMGVAAKPYGAFGTAAHSSCGNGKAVSSADWGEPAGVRQRCALASYQPFAG